MVRRAPRATRTDTLFPDTTLFRSRRTELVEPADDGIHGNGSARDGLRATAAPGAARAGRRPGAWPTPVRNFARKHTSPPGSTSPPHMVTPPSRLAGAAERGNAAAQGACLRHGPVRLPWLLCPSSAPCVPLCCILTIILRPSFLPSL